MINIREINQFPNFPKLKIRYCPFSCFLIGLDRSLILSNTTPTRNTHPTLYPTLYLNQIDNNQAGNLNIHSHLTHLVHLTFLALLTHLTQMTHLTSQTH